MIGDRGGHALYQVHVGGRAGGYAADDEGVGAGAVGGFLGGEGDVGLADGLGVFDVHVAGDEDIRRDGGPAGEELGGAAGYEALIGRVDTREHVHSDECRAGGTGDGEAGEAVVAEHVDADGDFDGADDMIDHDGHGGDGFCRDAIGVERGIAEVFDDDSVEAGIGEELGLGDGAVDDFLHRQHGAGGAGERGEMDHGDEAEVGEGCRGFRVFGRFIVVHSGGDDTGLFGDWVIWRLRN